MAKTKSYNDPRFKFNSLKESGWFLAMSGTDSKNIRLYDPWGNKTLFTIDEAWEIEQERRIRFEVKHETKVPDVG